MSDRMMILSGVKAETGNVKNQFGFHHGAGDSAPTSSGFQ